MKIILDTNVLVSGVFWRGPANRILNLWAENKIKIIVSPEILKEYKQILFEIELKKPSGLTNSWITFIIKNSTLILPRQTFKICRDPDDDKFLNCAISGKVQYIISGDKDLLVLGKISNIPIVSPNIFLQRIHSEII